MIVSVTRIKLKNPLKLIKFLPLLPKIMNQAARSPGNISYKGRYKGYLTFWTLTTWDNEGILRDFVLSGIHKEVMKRTRYFSDDFETTNWIIDNGAPAPDWHNAENRLLNKK